MNAIQSLIDRQLGIYCRLNYDSILKRLVVSSEESFYGLQSAASAVPLDQDPPIFACRFAEAAGYEHILALANEDGRLAIQDTTSVKSAQLLESFQCHNNAVFDLAWMPGSMNFVTVSGDHTACLWDINEGTPKQVLVFSNHTRSVKTAVFRPHEASVFASGGRDGHVLVWDVRAAAQPAVVLKPDNCLTSCHASAAPKTPGSHGKRPRIERRAISITGLVFQDDRTLLSCGECDGNVKVWDLRKNYSVYRREPLPKHSIPYCGSSTKNGYTNLIVDDARVRLYASCMDNVIYCFNISTYSATPERRYLGHENATFYIKTSLSPDCEYLVSGSSDKLAYVWSVREPEPVLRLAGHRAEVTCAAWAARGDPKLVTCSDDARHMIWRIGPELISTDRELEGRAEPVPRSSAARPQWGALERTPASLKRRAAADAGCPKRLRANAPSARKTKRCLADLMNAGRDADDAESAVKRLRLDPPATEDEKLLPAGIKRHIECSPPRCGDDWGYIAPGAGTSFVTPTKNYEARGCRLLSPRRADGTVLSPRSPESPKCRIIAFRTPTKDLPDFVLNGEAPHLRLMSPCRKKQDRTDWLTQISRDKRWRTDERPGEKPPEKPTTPSSPRDVPPRRSSVDRTPKSSKKARTLLKYFNVTTKK